MELADPFEFEEAKEEALDAMHRLKLLRKSASLVKNSGDEIFVYAVNALAEECTRFAHIAARLNLASRRKE